MTRTAPASTYKLAAAFAAASLLTACGAGSGSATDQSLDPSATANTTSPTVSTTTMSKSAEPTANASTRATATATSAQPTTKSRGSSATFTHFKVTVNEVVSGDGDRVLVLAKVCVRNAVSDQKRTSISWIPWSIETGSQRTEAQLSGNPPKGMFPSNDTYPIKGCASGWIPFDTTGQPNRITYANGIGDTAVWDASRLGDKPTIRPPSTSSPRPPTSTPKQREQAPDRTEEPKRAKPKPSPTWDGEGYTKANYKDRVDDIPEWIGLVRRDYADGMDMTVGADLTGLQHRFEEVGVLPAPPGVDKAYWYASTTTLTRFAEKAAEEWDDGDSIAAMSRLEVISENSNKLIGKVNKAFDLRIPKSK